MASSDGAAEEGGGGVHSALRDHVSPSPPMSSGRRATDRHCIQAHTHARLLHLQKTISSPSPVSSVGPPKFSQVVEVPVPPLRPFHLADCCCCRYPAGPLPVAVSFLLHRLAAAALVAEAHTVATACAVIASTTRRCRLSWARFCFAFLTLGDREWICFAL